jgi:hypothetical protein
MNPFTDPFAAKLVITGLCLLACAVSFVMGRLSSEMFASDDDSSQNETTEE